MPLIYTVIAAQRHYLRNTPTGVEFTTDRAAADNIRFQTMFGPQPHTLHEAARQQPSFVELLFPDPVAAYGLSPLRTKSHTFTSGDTLATGITVSASGVSYRWWWAISRAPATEGDGYIIALYDSPDHSLAVSPGITEDPGARLILEGSTQRGRDTASTPGIFYEEERSE